MDDPMPCRKPMIGGIYDFHNVVRGGLASVCPIVNRASIWFIITVRYQMQWFLQPL